MNKKELRQRGKGLLALMLALIMMFGTSMTVLAATTHYLDGGAATPSLKAGDKLKGGDTIHNKTVSGFLNVYIDDAPNSMIPSRNWVDNSEFQFVELPTGCDYEVSSYNVGKLYDGIYRYDVKLKSIPIPPSGGNTGGNTASTEVLEASQTETGNGGGQPHIHTYTWVTTREATETQDGLEEYKCACGAVEAQLTIPASQVVVNGFYQTIRGAASDGRITYDTKDYYTLSDKMIACLAERTDVTVEITFSYQKTPYRMTIPAGSDYSALLADEDMFYGYFYFANQIGAQIEPVS